MRLIRSAMTLATILGLCSANAGHNEQFWQAADGEAAFTASWAFHTKDKKTKAGAESNASSNVLVFEYERGLSASYALGTTVTYKVLHTSASSLIDNLDLYLKGHSGENFHWGVDLELNTGDKEKGAYDAMRYGFYLGYDFGSGWGARLNYLNSAEQSNKLKAGDDIRLIGYYEHMMGETHWGYEASYIMTGDSKAMTSGASVKDGTSLLEIKAYPTWKMGDGTLLTGLSYQMLLNDNSDSIDSINNLAVEVGYRMPF